MHKLLPLIALASMASCSTMHSPTVETSAQYTSQYWFRGAIQHEGGAFQGDLTVKLKTEQGDTVGLSAWGNMDASNDAGDAPFPDGNGGDFSEIDLIGWYGTELGAVPVELGFVNYDFPNGVGSSTTEVFATAAWPIAAFSLGLAVYYDIDALEDYYANVALSHSMVLDGNLSLHTGVSLGAMGEDQAAAYFGTADAGIADLNLGVTLNYQIDAVCSAFFGATSTSVVSSDYEDALNAAGYNDGDVWFNFGLAWSY
jgi:uncharacterized protein (TIGR02001 family)